MKLIIDIPDQEYEDIQAYNINMDGIDVVCESILHGIPIPDNATNGDVIKALFKPNWIRRMDDVVREEYEFNEVWWNAPYKKGGKE